MLSFVREFAEAVFQGGGHVLHGSHPSFTPVLLAEAAKYMAGGGRKDCLTLAVSKFWSKDNKLVPVQDWRSTCMVYEIPEATGESARDDSLQLLRKWMSDRCDAFVAVGGRWWHEVAGRAGVPIEASMAVERGLPCFLLGGLGGAAHDYVRDHPAVISSLKNGLDDATNRSIATNEDVGSLIQLVCDQLARLPLVKGRVSDGISFRILALDGGGIRGAFTASVLATLEHLLGVPIAESFDLVAGTSTGGILAVGLGMGLTSGQMLNFYRDKGSVIFPMTQLHGRWKHEIRHVFRPKFSQDILLRELKKSVFPRQKREGTRRFPVSLSYSCL
jgi:hypothetical protein